MPNPKMNAAKMKAEALKKAKANRMKSKMGSPNKKTGKAKPACLLYTSPSPRDRQKSRMPSSA